GIRMGDNGGKEALEVASEAVNGGGIKEIGIEFDLSNESLSRFTDTERNIEYGRAPVDFQCWLQCVRALLGSVRYSGCVEKLKYYLKERVAREVAIRLKVLDKHFEGEVLMSIGGDGHVPDEL